MKIDKKIVEGKFIARLNRFLAQVMVDGAIAYAHVPNSGRLRELFKPGARVFMTCETQPARKTPFDLIMVLRGEHLVSCDARLPNKLVEEALTAHAIPEVQGYCQVKREVRFQRSRFDFMLSGGPKPWLLEIKSVTLVKGGIALFPDAPTARGTEHMERLINALQEGFHAAVLFVVQRSDAHGFAPNDIQDSAFGVALRKAKKAGVKVLAYDCRVRRWEVKVARPLPVQLPPLPPKG